VFLFQVICSVYLSDKMKTLDRIVKHYDETIMLMEDYQTQTFEYLLEKKGRVFDYFW